MDFACFVNEDRVPGWVLLDKRRWLALCVWEEEGGACIPIDDCKKGDYLLGSDRKVPSRGLDV